MSEKSTTIKLIDVKTDNIVDYKETSILLVFPYCSGKCGPKCHNYKLIGTTKINEYKIEDIVNLYNKLNTHRSIVCAGLEPFDSFEDLTNIVKYFSNCNKDCDIVIYTGYTEEEIKYSVKLLNDIFNKNLNKSFKKSLIIKFGRYVFDAENSYKYYSDILGVELASNNQYAKIINKNEKEHK